MHSVIKTLKPIFHCDAKLFALGTCVGLDPQRHTFASPNAKYTNMLVYFGVTLTLTFALAPTQNFKFALAPTPTPDASQWNIGDVGSSGIGHVPGSIPVSADIFRRVTYLSWFPGLYSIHYISNWQLIQRAGYTMFRWFLVGRDNTVV